MKYFVVSTNFVGMVSVITISTFKSLYYLLIFQNVLHGL